MQCGVVEQRGIRSSPLALHALIRSKNRGVPLSWQSRPAGGPLLIAIVAGTGRKLVRRPCRQWNFADSQALRP